MGAPRAAAEAGKRSLRDISGPTRYGRRKGQLSSSMGKKEEGAGQGAALRSATKEAKPERGHEDKK